MELQFATDGKWLDRAGLLRYGDLVSDLEVPTAAKGDRDMGLHTIALPGVRYSACAVHIG